MLLIYGDYSFTAAVTGGTGAAFLEPTDGSALFNGRTGQVQACRWPSGAQTTGTFFEITVTITSARLDTTPYQGGAMLANVIGLPVNTRVVIAGAEQRLVADANGELNSIVLPFTSGGTSVIRIYNDQGAGAHTITASQEFALGGFLTARLIALPTLLSAQAPQTMLIDQTARQQAAGGNIWEVMRKPTLQDAQQLGPFTRKQARGGLLSNLGLSGQALDVKRLMTLLATARICAVCMAPHSGISTEISTTSGIKFNQAFMQTNWMMARPSNLNSLAVWNGGPYEAWSPVFEQAK